MKVKIEEQAQEQAPAPVTESSNEYLEKVRMKRKRNEEKIQELGLQNMKKKKLRTPTKLTRVDKSKVGIVTPPARRSARVSKKPVEFVALDANTDYEARLLTEKIERRAKSRSKPTKGKNLKKRAFDLGSQISDKKRAALEPIPVAEWAADMEFYFAEVEDNSASNVQRVMSVVNKLVDGRGVRHPHTHEFFLKNKVIHLGMDFRQMLDEASEWVYNNGGDRGNGWLIEHPVKKLWIYQQARSKNKKGNAFSDE